VPVPAPLLSNHDLLRQLKLAIECCARLDCAKTSIKLLSVRNQDHILIEVDEYPAEHYCIAYARHRFGPYALGVVRLQLKSCSPGVFSWQNRVACLALLKLVRAQDPQGTYVHFSPSIALHLQILGKWLRELEICKHEHEGPFMLQMLLASATPRYKQQ
jgi:hypothetical protein